MFLSTTDIHIILESLRCKLLEIDALAKTVQDVDTKDAFLNRREAILDTYQRMEDLRSHDWSLYRIEEVQPEP